MWKFDIRTFYDICRIFLSKFIEKFLQNKRANLYKKQNSFKF